MDYERPNTIYTTRDIADLTGIPKRTALRRLNKLADAAEIEKDLPHDKTAIWIRHDD